VLKLVAILVVGIEKVMAKKDNHGQWSNFI
jgi:hypothetical protein